MSLQTRFKNEVKSSEVKGFTTRGNSWEWQQSWFLLFFLTYFGYWLALVYMGLRALQFRWVIYALFYAGPSLVLLAFLHYGDAAQAAIGPGAMRYLWYSTS